MNGYNRVVLMGNLTRDPALRQIASGTQVADMGLASNATYKRADGESVEKTCFVDIVAWGKQAETCSRFLKKGAPVLVEGRLEFDQWQAADGQKRSKLRVRVDRVQFLGGPRRDGSATPAGPAKPAGAAAEQPEGQSIPF